MKGTLPHALDAAISDIKGTRLILLKTDANFREAELCYQLTSLVMEINQHLGGGYLSMDTIYEKTESIARICKNIKIEMNSREDTYEEDDNDTDPDLKFPKRMTDNQK